jgi:hypothetical protein
MNNKEEREMRVFRKSIWMVFLAVFMLVFATAPLMAASLGSTTATKPSTVKNVHKSTTKSGSKSLPNTMRMKKDASKVLENLPHLSITAFKKAVPSGTMLAPAAIMGGASSSPSSASVALGDEIELYWSIEYGNARNLRVTIDGRTITGETHVASDGTPWMSGRVTYRPAQSKTFNMVATAVPEGGGRALRAQKSFRVTVEKPVLTILEPEVDQDNLIIKFFAKNTGNADFRPTPIIVMYQVQGGALADGTFTTPRMGIRKNQRVELGRITLSSRNLAFQRNSIQIKVDIGASYVQPLESDHKTFTHDWIAQTTTISDAMLNLLGMATTCEITIDNWDETVPSSNWRRNPYQENGCLVDFNIAGSGSPMNFTLPYYDTTSGALLYRIFLRNIHAYHRGDSDLFSVNNGKLQITLNFDGRDSREIKIGLVGKTGSRKGKWKDDYAPDVNLSAFTVTIQVTPDVKSGQLTYSDVDVSVSGLRANFPGGWSWLDAGFQGYATRTVRNTLDSALTSVLNSNSIKSAIISGINDGISASGTDITRILNVRGSGDTIVVEYL